jgi:hypothetical protein
MRDESVRPEDDVKVVKRQVKQDAKEAVHEAQRAAKVKTERGMEKAAHQLDSIAEAIDAAALKLDEENKQGLADYAFRASEGIAQLAEKLQSRSIDDLAEEAKRLARNNPGLFLLGSVALGFGLSRFMKASEERADEEWHSRQDTASTQSEPFAARVPPAAGPFPPWPSPEQPQP